MTRISYLLASAVLLMLCCLPATARPYSSPVLSLENPLIGVEVVDSSGNPQEIELRHGRLVTDLVEGEPYALRLTNRSDRRVKVVVSIDGVNPRDGTRAYQGQPGVVLPPGTSAVLATGRPSRRAPEGAILPLRPDVGNISLLALKEAGAYPVIGVGYPPAPRGPEHFRVNAKGEREWIPPQGYPFRRDRSAKEERTYMEYELVSPSPMPLTFHPER